MNLLIVDDQSSVIEGLRQGIPWESLRIDNVFTALNALDAKQILVEKQIDIVLSDIEMPVENGIDLYKWMREKQIASHCIFLTSHAEFSYAQDALRLGAFDYIIQPAPYDEVTRVVRKAVLAVENEREKETTLEHGEIFEKQRKTIAGNAIRNLLRGLSNREYMHSLANLNLLPRLDLQGYLVMIHIVEWHTASEIWEGGLLEIGLENVTSEIFGANQQKTGFACLEENVFALMIQGSEGERIPPQSLTRQLQFLSSVCKQYYKCSIACYFSRAELLENAPERWKDLQMERDNNVLLKTGIFAVSDMKQPEEICYRVPQIRHWHMLLKEGYAATVEQEALTLLDDMSEKGNLDKTVLRYYYQDFMQMLYVTMEEGGVSFRVMFETTEAMELYQNGMKSVEQMRKLIHFATQNFHTGGNEADTATIVQAVVQYIAEHLEEDLRRDELAAIVHINPDHLTRVFKKEMGLTLKEYITKQKMLGAQGLLRTTNLPVSFVAAKMGYSNFSHFSFTYKKVMGNTPQEERG